MATAAISAALILAGSCSRPEPQHPLLLATTTSVANSGLLDRVLPAYQPRRVRALQVGSGLALDMAATGSADVVISHAPEREARTLKSHPKWFYRKILYNDFLIVGPQSDPAGIKDMTDAAAAMKLILDSGQRFLSRGDESGTHERERQLWAAAGVAGSDRIVVAGAGMGQTLRIANSTDAYTLTDRGTFEALASSLQLRALVSGDPRLLNTYAVLADSANEPGLAFARWLAEGGGRATLTTVLTSGQVRGFSIWPAERDGTRPDSRPF
jgi:tungstate transport system substrate-binding protein